MIPGECRCALDEYQRMCVRRLLDEDYPQYGRSVLRALVCAGINSRYRWLVQDAHWREHGRSLQLVHIE